MSLSCRVHKAAQELTRESSHVHEPWQQLQLV